MYALLLAVWGILWAGGFKRLQLVYQHEWDTVCLRPGTVLVLPALRADTRRVRIALSSVRALSSRWTHSTPALARFRFSGHTFNASARPLAHPPSPSPSPPPPPPPSCRSTTRRRRPTGGILSKTLRPTSGSTKKARARSSIRTPFFVLPGSSPARSSSDLTCPARHCTADAPAHIAHLIAGSVTHTHTHEQGACVVLIAVNLGLVLAVEVRANLNPKP